MDNAAFLRSIPLFSKLDEAELQRFGELTREKNYPKGSVIVFEDDPGDSLFIVRDGRVKVVLIGEDGREVILGVLGVGEHFGELSLIDDMPRSAHSRTACVASNSAATWERSISSQSSPRSFASC